jgi:hypothetical protein
VRTIVQRVDVPGCWRTAEYTADIVTAAIGKGVHTSPEFTRNLEGGKKEPDQSDYWTLISKSQSINKQQIIVYPLPGGYKDEQNTNLPSSSLYLLRTGTPESGSSSLNPRSISL